MSHIMLPKSIQIITTKIKGILQAPDLLPCREGINHLGGLAGCLKFF